MSLRPMGVAVTLDAGAFIAADRGNERVGALLARAYARDLPLRAPSVVLAECHRRGPVSHTLSRMRQAIEWVDVDQRLAEMAGLARAASGPGPSAVDAIVATIAALSGGVVWTTDPGDFESLRSYYPTLRALAV